MPLFFSIDNDNLIFNYVSNLIIFSPLSQFEVTSLIGFNAPIIGNFNLSITNFSLYTFLTLFLIIGLHFYGDNESNLIPNK